MIAKKLANNYKMTGLNIALNHTDIIYFDQVNDRHRAFAGFKMNPNPLPTDLPDSLPEWLRIVAEKVASLRYGVVQIVVHDHKVTQIERTEKTRLDPSRGDTAIFRDHI